MENILLLLKLLYVPLLGKKKVAKSVAILIF